MDKDIIDVFNYKLNRVAQTSHNYLIFYLTIQVDQEIENRKNCI